MSELRSLQRQALASFLGDASEPGANRIDAGRVRAKVLIDVYRNNLRENYRKCLAVVYPIVERLVGTDCFRGLAAQYSRLHPSTNADLQFFGRAFPFLLEELYGDSDFAYLHDVALLELAIEDALIAPRMTAIDIERLAEVEPTDYPQIRFRLRPGLSLIRSDFPILKIWQANQTSDAEFVDLAEGSEQLAVHRERESAEIRRLDPGAFALAECLADGLTLGKASERLEKNRDFDLSASLNSLFLNRCLGGFELATGEYLDS